MANVIFIDNYTHSASFKLMTSPFTLLLQGKEVPFKIEFNGTIWSMLYIDYKLLLESD
jgi:hypothetical protein